LYYTTSSIITPAGGRPVHRLREDSQPQPDDEHIVFERYRGV